MMAFLKKWLFIFVMLAVFIVALLAAADNSEEVALKFMDFETPVWPISWWILTAFVIGVLFGNLLNVVSNTRLRMNARRANKMAAARTQELDRMNAVNTEQRAETDVS